LPIVGKKGGEREERISFAFSHCVGQAEDVMSPVITTASGSGESALIKAITRRSLAMQGQSSVPL
jgi:hypothetical protein